MSPPLVIDASVALAWCFEGERTEWTAEILRGLPRREALVPGVWPLEVANGLLGAARRQRIAWPEVVQSAALLSVLPIRVQPEPGARVLSVILDLARAHGLSVYDASYLDLALREGAALATLDAALARAATEAGVALA